MYKYEAVTLANRAAPRSSNSNLSKHFFMNTSQK